MVTATAGSAAPLSGKFRSQCCGYLVSLPTGEQLPRCRWCDGASSWRFEGAWRDLHASVRPNNGAVSATASPPSVASMTVAAGAMAASLILMLTGRSNVANFIGQWAPAILMMGIYNKITPRAP